MKKENNEKQEKQESIIVSNYKNTIEYNNSFNTIISFNTNNSFNNSNLFKQLSKYFNILSCKNITDLTKFNVKSVSENSISEIKTMYNNFINNSEIISEKFFSEVIRFP